MSDAFVSNLLTRREQPPKDTRLSEIDPGDVQCMEAEKAVEIMVKLSAELNPHLTEDQIRSRLMAWMTEEYSFYSAIMAQLDAGGTTLN